MLLWKIPEVLSSCAIERLTMGLTTPILWDIMLLFFCKSFSVVRSQSLVRVHYSRNFRIKNWALGCDYMNLYCSKHFDNGCLYLIITLIIGVGWGSTDPPFCNNKT